MQNYKDENICIIQLGSHTTVYGNGDPLYGFGGKISTRIGRVKNEEGQETGQILCGKALREALRKKQEVQVIYPIQNGVVKDWKALSDFMIWILTQEMGVRRAINDKPLFLSIPQSWTIEDAEQLTRIAFEDMNCAVYSYSEKAPLALFGAASQGQAHGLMIDIGHESTEIIPIIDNTPLRQAMVVLPVGGKDVDQYLYSLLQQDSAFTNSLQGGIFTIEFARSVKETGSCHAILPQEISKLQPINVEVGSRVISIGSARSECINVLFDPSLVQNDSIGLAEGIAVALSRLGPKQRSQVCEFVILSGGSSAFPGLFGLIQHHLQPHLSVSETTDGPRDIVQAKIPEYFTQMKETPQYVAFTGAQIVSQIVFRPADRLFISRQDYANFGPVICHTKAVF